jgi:hypothetical protein
MDLQPPEVKPSWRKPAGVIGLIVGLALYALCVAAASPLIQNWPALLQAPIYLVLGVIWILPLRPLLLWMETGRWKVPS